MKNRRGNRFTLEGLLGLRGVTSAGELRRALGISPATLSRRVATASGKVVRMGRARAVSYALRHDIPGLEPVIPAFRVGEDGTPVRVATLVPLQGGETWVERRTGEGHLHAGLPPVVADMAPSGYLGRRFGEQHPDLTIPHRVNDWQDRHRWLAVARRGEELPGDLVLGTESMDRWLAAPPTRSTHRDFPRLAESSARGSGGSSAGGEQPKFTAFVAGNHVLVKFSPGDGTSADGRWRDLLVCESLALETLRGAGLPAAEAEVVDVGPRRFLVVERFDRVGARGRRGVLTLGYLDDDLFGARDSWTLAADRLEAGDMLSPQDARRMRLLDAFGAAIHNGDRHFHNVAFFTDGLQGRPRLSLAPAYDVLPMNLAPRVGHVPSLVELAPAAPRSAWLESWPEASRLAGVFWKRVAADARVSAPMRRAARLMSAAPS